MDGEYGYIPEAWMLQSRGQPDGILSDVDDTLFHPLDMELQPMLPTQPLGRLDVLPLELLTDIVLPLDIPSLVSFRQANRRALQVVDSVPQYRKLRQHCSQILRCIYNVEARSFSLETLYNTLRTSACASCGSFGGYLYLLTCERVCQGCFAQKQCYLPMSWEEANRITRLPRRIMRQRLVCIQAYPGRYGESLYECRDRPVIYDRKAMLAMLPVTSMLRFSIIFMAQEDVYWHDPRRHMGIVRAPYFEKSSPAPQWGVYCLGCQIVRNRGLIIFRSQYRRTEFRDHISRFGPVVIREDGEAEHEQFAGGNQSYSTSKS